tara:strand:+ start:166 stop:339 length:174 start_codon:yes stop_codon:yes gene_type:complete
MRKLAKINGHLSVFCLALAGVSFAVNGDNWAWVHYVGVFGAVICAVGCYAAWLAEDC